MSAFTEERARLAATTRHHPDNPELVAAARGRLHMARAERLIARLVGSEPALTFTQRAHLARQLLADGGGADAA